MRKLRSDITRDGLARTPHRAFMRAMGLDDAAIQKPMIGVVSMKDRTVASVFRMAKSADIA
jgi:dihydroxy-acid dehydratase